ncbi:phosphonate ABC transporter, inner membrane subunit [Alkaliphilus metalliredigens QYMF]|uniref:Phosphonate ABC transporter, inner membrane subunit n=1 Tax=Alkaliphilus metalliredigens (strain QYMF) TaxID=293826 RepID=A6TMF3_ALKMQ|nr:phosphonate ABC transporter, permease protein PhnE [Alkaliphilus metalliredigens]ABR47371.1 phosphonate ABC transporter, inner membrane subunit [Alkaliphilus metalliredigens QYMF]
MGNADVFTKSKTIDRLDSKKEFSLSHKLYRKYQKNRKSKFYHLSTIWGFGIFITLWSWWGTEFKMYSIISSLGSMFEFIFKDLLPPDLSVARSMISATMDTLYMSIVGVAISIVLSLIFAILSAKTTAPNVFIGEILKNIVSMIRSFPTIIFGIFLVATFGLGTFTGALALGVGGIGMLGKAYTESLEQIDPGQVEALKSVGASWFQIIGQAIMPQFKPSFIAWSLHQVDYNIRDSAILGMIGAGGLGMVLIGRIRLFQYSQAATAILLIFILIIIVEYITSKIREQLI